MGQYPRYVEPHQSPVFSDGAYIRRQAVKPFINKLKHLSAIATRHDKPDDKHLTCANSASIRIWRGFSALVNHRCRPMPDLRGNYSEDFVNCNIYICLTINR